ncbi:MULTISPECIES: beta-galactosidase family protein [unclassified Streptococcus]|uniref:glycoside hydrolase family 35 protein n=1 Tax=unclassified Streptococcus TaxID=2608887 RepID=UPI00107209D1|nr:MULTISPECIES: beta-galactosidase family protein [unclassified Streptococcus]MBF0806064.1 beta-galactosidase [Streptococcus sp. 19428wA2_WM07]TFU28360.1 beta-galactosidase [Streptococcus sp. WM07]
METFSISQDFLLNEQPFKILSGAVHYFRIPRADWYHTLYNLKALGFNTVETYVPWNLHEAQEGGYDFQGELDLGAFLDLAQEFGLYALIRPSPYICAEWEFGGVPAWLLTKNIRIRSSDPGFLSYVDLYYHQLGPILAQRQLNRGGNILMFQVENEYGSYGEDKAYLRRLKGLMEKQGWNMPYFTSDGAWLATLQAGTLLDEGILPTGNFGSKAEENFANLQNFMQEHDFQGPLMCMEFWLGWFNRWKEPIIQRDSKETVAAIMDTLKRGSINLYMFHGGTNFGFMNGTSARGNRDLPQVTSYDYDAILDEVGNPTEKYYLLQEAIHQWNPALEQSEPLVKPMMENRVIQKKRSVSLWSTLNQLTQSKKSLYPMKMEELGQATGYILYRKQVAYDGHPQFYRLVDVSDRAQVFINQVPVVVQDQDTVGDSFEFHSQEASDQLDILVENQGRVNYGHKLLAASQEKGIRTGVIKDLHFLINWEQFPLSFDSNMLNRIDFDGDWECGQPGFHEFEFELEELLSCHIDVSGFGKGFISVNGHNLGRFWEVGPYLSLYLPAAFLKKGINTLLVFESEGMIKDNIQLGSKPVIKEGLEAQKEEN